MDPYNISGLGFTQGQHQLTADLFPYPTPQGISQPAPLPQPHSSGAEESWEFSDSDSSPQDPASPAPSHAQGPHKQQRKRRRGMIEKRRRDRINACLAELRRLVPAAFQRQGSQKLEKAEILQLTVEHLGRLNAQGPAAAADAHDWHSLGFRECASEVARFLASAEGLHVHHPLRLRLMGHLQCYSAQGSSASTGLYPPQGGV